MSSLTLRMVPLKSSQRCNSDLDRAAGQGELRHFSLPSDQNSVAISPLYCLTQHTLGSALERL